MSNQTSPQNYNNIHIENNDAASSSNDSNSRSHSNRMPSLTTRTTTTTTADDLTPNNAQKKRFLLFIKILFKSLDESEENSELRENAKSIISDCTRRNRLGDPDYDPLMDAVDRRLRRHVGEIHWRKAHVYMQHYIRREAARKCLPRSIRTAMV